MYTGKEDITGGTKGPLKPSVGARMRGAVVTQNSSFIKNLKSDAIKIHFKRLISIYNSKQILNKIKYGDHTLR